MLKGNNGTEFSGTCGHWVVTQKPVSQWGRTPGKMHPHLRFVPQLQTKAWQHKQESRQWNHKARQWEQKSDQWGRNRENCKQKDINNLFTSCCFFYFWDAFFASMSFILSQCHIFVWKLRSFVWYLLKYMKFCLILLAQIWFHIQRHFGFTVESLLAHPSTYSQ